MRAEVLGDLHEFGIAGLGAASHHRIDNGRPLIARSPSAHDDVRAVTGRSANFVCDISAGAFRQWLTRLLRGTGHLSEHGSSGNCQQSQRGPDPQVRIIRGKGFIAKMEHQPRSISRQWLVGLCAALSSAPRKRASGACALRLLLPSLPPLSFGTNDRPTIGLGKPMSIRHILC